MHAFHLGYQVASRPQLDRPSVVHVLRSQNCRLPRIREVGNEAMHKEVPCAPATYTLFAHRHARTYGSEDLLSPFQGKGTCANLLQYGRSKPTRLLPLHIFEVEYLLSQSFNQFLLGYSTLKEAPCKSFQIRRSTHPLFSQPT